MKRSYWPLLLLAGVPLPAIGLSNGEGFCPDEIACIRASDAELDRIRGGFTLNTPAGRLEIGIGITRAVEVNNRIVAVSRLVLPDLAQMLAAARSSAQAARARAAASTVLLANEPPRPEAAPAAAVPQSPVLDLAGGTLVVQNGPGNVAPAAVAFRGTALPTIVQNSLNDQVLRTLTLVNASVSSLSALSSLGWGEMMQRATAATAR